MKPARIPDAIRPTVIYIIVSLFLMPQLSASAAEPSSLNDLILEIRRIHLQREKELRNARGIATIAVSRSMDSPGKVQEIRDQFGDLTNLNPENLVIDGKGVATIKWYTKDSLRRYDVLVSQDQQGTPEIVGKNLFNPQDLRIAVDQDKGIYYDALAKTAYLNKPPTETSNMAGVTRNFDVMRFYRFNNASVPDYLQAWVDGGYIPTMSRITLGGRNLVLIECISPKLVRSQLLLSPAEGYSLVSGEIYDIRGEVDKLVENYQITYKWEDSARVWLIDEYKNSRTPEDWFDENVNCRFEEIQLGVVHPEDWFSFDGLGVQPRDKIYDKRFGGNFVSYYKGMPTDAFDGIIEKVDDILLDMDNGEAQEIGENSVESGTSVGASKSDRRGIIARMTLLTVLVVILMVAGIGFAYLMRRRMKKTG